jgi:hypothetical protein
MWEGGEQRNLFFSPVSVSAINDRGEVVGLFDFGDVGKAAPFIYSNGTLLPIVGGSGGDLSVPAITNGDRVLVNGVDGYTTVIEGGQRLSFEFMPWMRAAGWRRLEPRAMNNNGWIVGYGSRDFGGTRKFLITPVETANPTLRAAIRTTPLIRWGR